MLRDTRTPQSKPGGKRWRQYLALLLGALVAGGWLYYALRPAEPTYHGKTAAQWFAALHQAYPRYFTLQVPAPVLLRTPGWPSYPPGPLVVHTLDDQAFRRDPALAALRALGTNAALYLAREYAREASPVAIQYTRLYVKLPTSLRHLVPEPPQSRAALRGLLQRALESLGDDAVPAVPLLLPVLRRGDSYTVRTTLQFLGQIRFDQRLVEPLLEDWSRTGNHTNVLRLVGELHLRTPAAARGLARAMAENPGLRQECMGELQRLGEQAAGAVPEVVAVLGDKDPETRYRAARTLEAIGPGAAAAKSALRQATNDPSTMVQHAAARALRVIEGAPED